MKPTPEQIVKAARSYKNVLYRHQGRTRFGLDCIGLIVRVSQDFGYTISDETNYRMLADGKRLREGMYRNFDVFPAEDRRAGDFVLLSFKGLTIHCGILGNGDVFGYPDLTLIHSLRTNGKVVEHRLDGEWSANVCNVFRLKGV